MFGTTGLNRQAVTTITNIPGTQLTIAESLTDIENIRIAVDDMFGTTGLTRHTIIPTPTFALTDGVLISIGTGSGGGGQSTNVQEWSLGT